MIQQPFIQPFDGVVACLIETVNATLVFRVLDALLDAVNVSGKLPRAVGVPVMAMVPLPLCIAVNPAGNPLTPAAVSGSTEPIIKLAEYACPWIASGNCGVTSIGGVATGALMVTLAFALAVA